MLPKFISPVQLTGGTAPKVQKVNHHSNYKVLINHF